MLRELLFKAWDTESSVMLDESDTLAISLDSLNSGDYLIPLQFTGISDKNEKMIFEGDILTVYRRGWDGHDILPIQTVVKWETKRMCWNIGDYHAKEDAIFEVIGNEYQHKELLK